MEAELLIESLQNPRVKQVVKLRERRQREQSGRFLIEGYRELLRALDGKQLVETLFICPELFLGSNEPALIEQWREQGTEICSCSERVFRKMSYRDRPDGLLAVAPQRYGSLDDLGADCSLIVVAEAIEKPGNLGTILRSADGVGADAVIVCDRCTDIHNPNVVRASVGTLFTRPVIECSSEDCIAWLKKRGFRVLSATPAAEAIYTDTDLTGPIAIAVGTEQLGLSDRWMNEADLQVRIPMCGTADSLNVATATTILLYEALRQRSSSPSSSSSSSSST